MAKVVRILDDLLDRLLALFLILVLMIGIWFVYDTVYVFYHASAGRVAAYRPGTAEAETARAFTRDYVAWLSVDNTSIEYPIMQGESNSTYLNRDPYGDYSLAGSIFLDSRNASDFSDRYNLTYGHHMAGGLMFGALDDFLDGKFLARHRTGTLTIGTGEEERALPFTIFAVLETDAGEDVLFQPQGSEKVIALARTQAKYYEEPKSTHILALSTCVDAVHTTRTVVLCALEGEMDR